jgi:hypothetical protein
VKEKNPQNPVNPVEYQKSSEEKIIEDALLQKMIDEYKNMTKAPLSYFYHPRPPNSKRLNSIFEG